jgi:COP9 signalosome complex subunit 5
VFLQYYSLDITYFKSSLDSHLLDLLWNKYWVNTLSSSPLLGNGDYVAGQISDLGNFLLLVPYKFLPFYFKLLVTVD